MEWSRSPNIAVGIEFKVGGGDDCAASVVLALLRDLVAGVERRLEALAGDRRGRALAGFNPVAVAVERVACVLGGLGDL